jgi:hypothetical protein
MWRQYNLTAVAPAEFINRNVVEQDFEVLDSGSPSTIVLLLIMRFRFGPMATRVLAPEPQARRRYSHDMLATLSFASAHF